MFKGHAACYSPLSKHKFEESNAKSLGPVYRFRNYNKLIVVVNSPELQQEVDSHLKPPNARFTMSFKAHWIDNEACFWLQIFAAEREGAIEKPDQPNGFSKGKGKGEMNVFSEKSSDPMWKLVRKGTAPAFAAQNLR